jgi:hypothetical protein
MPSPSPFEEPPNAGPFPEEVYPLAANVGMGIPLEEHVYPSGAASCLMTTVVSLLCIGGLLAGVYALTTFVVSSQLLPTPFLSSTAFGGLVLGLMGLAVLAGGILPSYALRGSILRREEENRRHRFRRTQLVYACSHGMLWLDRGTVSAAYPWQTIEGVRRVKSRNRRGGIRISWWLDLTDGSQERIDPSILAMIEAGLQRSRLSHGLPGTLPSGHAGEKRRIRRQYTMRGRDRWTWSAAGCVLLVILFLLCGSLANAPSIRSLRSMLSFRCFMCYLLPSRSLHNGTGMACWRGWLLD